MTANQLQEARASAAHTDRVSPSRPPGPCQAPWGEAQRCGEALFCPRQPRAFSGWTRVALGKKPEGRGQRAPAESPGEWGTEGPRALLWESQPGGKWLEGRCGQPPMGAQRGSKDATVGDVAPGT